MSERQRHGGEKEGKGHEEECWCRCSRERKEPGTIITAREKATESPWFFVKGKNLLMREVSLSLYYKRLKCVVVIVVVVVVVVVVGVCVP
jgi:hypothetical protein